MGGGNISELIIPVVILGVILYSALKGKDSYGVFCKGANKGLSLAMGILPYVGAMMIATGLLRDSGLMDKISEFLSPFFSRIGLPTGLIPLLLVKPFSGSGAISTLSDIYTVFGADSQTGIIASLIMGSTETVFYTSALYYGANGIKKTGYTLAVALLADTAAVITACMVYTLLYK